MEHVEHVKTLVGGARVVYLPAYPGNGEREVFGCTQAAAAKRAAKLLGVAKVRYLGLRRNTEGDLYSAWAEKP